MTIEATCCYQFGLARGDLEQSKKGRGISSMALADLM